MTVSAPAPIAFAMSPDEVSLPSAITGTPWRSATSAHSNTAVTWGTPTPATTRVVQIEPGPIPHLSASAPASTSASAASAVAMLLLVTTCTSDSALSRRTTSSTAPRVPVCRVDDEEVDLCVDQRAAARSSVAPDADRRADAQATPLVLRRVRNLDPLLDVLDGDEAAQTAVGVDDRQLLDLVPVEDRVRLGERRADRRRDEPRVISVETGWRTFVSKRRSRLVRIPDEPPASSVIGTPEIR